MEDLKRKLRRFAEERDWEQFHSPKNLAMALSVEVAEINEILSELNIKIDSDAALIIPDEEHPTVVDMPNRGIDSQFESITIVSSGNPRLHVHAPLDLLTLLQLRGEEKGMLLPLPIMPHLPSGKGLKGIFLNRQPCIVDSNPRSIDLLRISESNIHKLKLLNILNLSLAYFFRLPCLSI